MRPAAYPNSAIADRVGYIGNIGFRELETRETTEFRDRRVHVPASSPWHMREALPPAPLRQGNWMIDLWIDRLNDHCRYANERHSWLLPRRLRLDRAFKLERQRERSLNFELNVLRVLRAGCLTIPQNLEHGAASITVPDDMDAFAKGLCTDIACARILNGCLLRDSGRAHRPAANGTGMRSCRTKDATSLASSTDLDR